MNDSELLRLREVAELQPDFSPNALHLLKSHKAAICRLLGEMGFTHIRHSAGARDGFWEEGNRNALPLLRAQRNGREACIYLADAQESLAELGVMSSAAYDYADAYLLQEDVYYGAFVAGNDFSETLGLVGPVLLRREGAWLAEKRSACQFFPFDKRAVVDELSAIFGGAALCKFLSHMAALRSRAPRLSGYINGLVPRGQVTESPYTAHGFLPGPSVALLERFCDDGSRRYLNYIFHPASDPVSELEFLGFSAHERDCGVRLMDEMGHRFRARCMDALLLRPHLHPGQRFLWTLAMVATHCTDNTIPLGPGEMSITQRAQGHCGEVPECPPFEEGECLHTGAGRRCFHASEHHNRCVAAGVVECVEAHCFLGTDMYCLTIRCIPGNDRVSLNVYAAMHALGGYIPKPGDSIRCEGFLYAVPDTFVPASSWLQHPEGGLVQQGRRNALRAFRAYESFATRSIGMGAVLAALTHIGWEMEEHLWPHANTMLMRQPSGERTLIALDMVVNGVEPQMPTSPRELASCSAEQDATGGRFILRLALDYQPEAGRYSLRLLDSGSFPETLSLPNFLPRAFNPTVLCIHGSGVSERRQYPERLDERAMATLFARCLVEKDWASLARWLLEEMDYTSETVDTSFRNKQEYLGYLDSRRKLWEDVGHWERMCLTTGTVTYGGSRRACAALYLGATITALTIFEDGDGLVRSIRTISPLHYTDFVPLADILLPVNPEPESDSAAEADTPVPFAEWEEQRLAIAAAAAHCASLGYRVLRQQDVPDIDPQLWIEDAPGLRSWVLVRPACGAASRVELAAWPQDMVQQLAPQQGYIFRYRHSSEDATSPIQGEMQALTSGDWERGYI